MTNDDLVPSFLCTALMRIGTRMATTFDRYFADAGITQALFRTLLAVCDEGGEEGITPSALAEHLLIERATVSVLATRLVERGLLARLPGENRRTFRLVLTAEGHALLQRVIPRAVDLADETMAGIERRDLEHALSLLNLIERRAPGGFSMNTLFQVSSLFVMPFWFLMIFLPNWQFTKKVIASPWIGVGPALIYAALVLPRIGAIVPAVAHPTMAGVQMLLGTPLGTTLGWAHFLAFDVFVGRWMYLDSRERSISAWLASPMLFLTFMLGPLGWLLYLITRAATAALGRNPGVLRRAFGANAPLFFLTVSALALLIVCVGGLIFDHRVLLGVPIWLKPAKFAVSSAIYAATMIWVLGYARGGSKWILSLSWIIAACFFIEDGLIVMQAIRGTESHFNIRTPFDISVWTIMAVTILLLWVTNVFAAGLLLTTRLPDAAFAWSLRLGLGLAIIGMAVAFLMTQPTSAQLAGYAHGQIALAGAHTVGATDGGPGLPGVNWSTRHGDLRVPHFVGLHALQILPLIGWLLTLAPFRRLDERSRTALVWTAGIVYLGVIGLLTWQALRGQSVIAPDALTIMAFSALIGGATLIAGGICISGLRQTSTNGNPVPSR
jgi:DNA-binding MarR family transcriptional regulator